jgi:hypothetical protein
VFGSGRRLRREGVTCHLRENGPIGYELELFGQEPRAQVETLMNSGLGWAWNSGTREWTELTRISLSAILADLPSGALIVGLEGDMPRQVTDEMMKGWVRRFCLAESVPLAIAISVTPGRQIIFVQQHASATVTALLESLHLDRNVALRSAYPRLGQASLESIAERL